MKIPEMIGLTMFGPERLALSPQRGVRVHDEPQNVVRLAKHPTVTSDKASEGGLTLAHFTGDERRLANVEAVYGIGLDVDDGSATLEGLAEALGSYWFLGYSTFSSTPEKPKCRGILLFSRPATAAEYPPIWSHVASHLSHAGIVIDRATKDASRLWFLPCVKPGAVYQLVHHDGDAVDVDAVLVSAWVYEAEQRAMLERARAAIGGTPSLDRVRKYLATLDPAISGSGGHRATFRAACVIVANVANVASIAEQEALLAEYNLRCQPQWSAKALAHKLADARRQSNLLPLADRKRAS